MFWIFGIKIVALFYLCMGGLLGELFRAIFRGKAGDMVKEQLIQTVITLLGNLVSAWTLIHIYRQRDNDQPIENAPKTSQLLLRGLPFNNRVALGIFAFCWAVGLILGIFYSI